MLKSLIFGFVFGSCIISNVHAQDWQAKSFVYQGPVSNLVAPVWQRAGNFNNTISPATHHLFYDFWGAPDPSAGCQPGIANGPMGSAWFVDAYADTGLVSTNSSTSWTPISDPTRCTQVGWQGYTHAHLENYFGGGIGIYTHSGPKPDGSSPVFFQTAANGRNEIFPTFRINSVSPNPMLPFTGNSGDWNSLRVAAISVQGVTKFAMENPSTQQIRQITRLTFFHKGCNSPLLNCHLEVHFLNAVGGQNTNSSEAALIFDDGQGGIPVFTGKIGNFGGNTDYKSKPIWTSWSSPTQTGSYQGDKNFQVEISFNQFMTMMRYAVAEKHGVTESAVTDALMQQYYGGPGRYDDPSLWSLLQAGVGHEVHNTSQASYRAYIGGNLKSLTVLALPY